MNYKKILVVCSLFSTPLFHCAVPQEVVAAQSSEITPEIPVRCTSLLYAFMTGAFEVQENGTILYRHYKEEPVVYQDTIANVHNTLLATYNDMRVVKQDGHSLPARTKFIQRGLRPSTESDIAQMEMERFYIFMTNQDFKARDESKRTEIEKNRDELIKAFKAITTNTDVKAVAANIKKAQSKKLVLQKLVVASEYVPTATIEDCVEHLSIQGLLISSGNH